MQGISPAELEQNLDKWPFKERAKFRRYKIVMPRPSLTLFPAPAVAWENRVIAR